MYTNCYEHPIKLAAERMILKAVIHFRDNFSDKDLFFERLKLLTDDQLFSLILMNTPSNDQSYKIIQCLMSGLIFEQVYSVDLINPMNLKGDESKDYPQSVVIGQFLDTKDLKRRYVTMVQDYEEKFLSAANLPEEDAWKIAFHFPPEEAISGTETRIPILKKFNDTYSVVSAWTFPDFIKVHEFIRDARLKVKVFVHPGLSPTEKALIHDAAKKDFEIRE